MRYAVLFSIHLFSPFLSLSHLWTYEFCLLFPLNIFWPFCWKDYHFSGFWMSIVIVVVALMCISCFAFFFLSIKIPPLALHPTPPLTNSYAAAVAAFLSYVSHLFFAVLLDFFKHTHICFKFISLHTSFLYPFLNYF